MKVEEGKKEITDIHTWAWKWWRFCVTDAQTDGRTSGFLFSELSLKAQHFSQPPWRHHCFWMLITCLRTCVSELVFCLWTRSKYLPHTNWTLCFRIKSTHVLGLWMSGAEIQNNRLLLNLFLSPLLCKKQGASLACVFLALWLHLQTFFWKVPAQTSQAYLSFSGDRGACLCCRTPLPLP